MKKHKDNLEIGYEAIRQDLMLELSLKQNYTYVMEGALTKIKEIMPLNIFNFFYQSKMELHEFMTEFVAFSDLILRLKKYHKEANDCFRASTTSVNYNQIGPLLERYDYAYQINDGFLSVKGRTPVEIASEDIVREVEEVCQDKKIIISFSTKNEEKKQPYVMKEKQVFNTMLTADLEPVLAPNDYEKVEIPIKPHLIEDPFDYTKLSLSNKCDDPNYLVQSVLPDMRKANPDYLYAIGHKDAHYYPREAFLFDRFVAIFQSTFFQDKKDRLRILAYEEYNRRKLKQKGFIVYSGFKDIQNKNDIIVIYPDICDQKFEGLYEDSMVPAYMETINRFMSEVNKIKTICPTVYYPFYPTMIRDDLNVTEYAPLTYHRPFVMVVNGITQPKSFRQAYFWTTVRLSYYRTYLASTGEKYDSDFSKNSHNCIIKMLPFFKTLNDMTISSSGYVMRSPERELLPVKEVFEAKEIVPLYGNENEYLKYIAPVLNGQLEGYSNSYDKTLIKNTGGKIEVAYKTNPDLLKLAKYLRYIERELNRHVLYNRDDET